MYVTLVMCRIEGEGFLYDGEQRKWPDPQKWNQKEISMWMVRAHKLARPNIAHLKRSLNE